MSYRRFYRRRFLNRPRHHAGAYVLADCSIESYRNGPEISADLTIGDCGRIVSLNFNGWDKSSTSNALSKARALRTVVDEFCDALEAAAVEVEARREAVDSKNA